MRVILRAAHLTDAPHFIVADVSFISLKLALPPALDLGRAGAKLVALIKPQFEAGQRALGKGGIVEAIRHYVNSVRRYRRLAQEPSGWRVIGIDASPIAGGDGNREFLIAAEKPC